MGVSTVFPSHLWTFSRVDFVQQIGTVNLLTSTSFLGVFGNGQSKATRRWDRRRAPKRRRSKRRTCGRCSATAAANSSGRPSSSPNARSAPFYRVFTEFSFYECCRHRPHQVLDTFAGYYLVLLAIQCRSFFIYFFLVYLVNLVLPSFTQFYQALPSLPCFTYFYLLLPSLSSFTTLTLFYLILPSSSQSYLVLPSSTQFHHVHLRLSSFTQFHIVLLYVTQFYLVLPS